MKVYEILKNFEEIVSVIYLISPDRLHLMGSLFIPIHLGCLNHSFGTALSLTKFLLQLQS